jgi:CheY-like chemotaxis protein
MVNDRGVGKPLSLVLKNEGYMVGAVVSGAETIKKVKTDFYNLALVDVRLPDTNSWKC